MYILLYIIAALGRHPAVKICQYYLPKNILPVLLLYNGVDSEWGRYTPKVPRRRYQISACLC